MQSSLLPESEAPGIEMVLASLRRLRVQSINLEYDLQAMIAAQLAADHIPYSKEHRLGPRNRIDFLISGGIGIEIKKGKPNSSQVTAQVERYCRYDAVTALILLVERNVFTYDRSANGKPVHYIGLHKLWGIAL